MRSNRRKRRSPEALPTRGAARKEVVRGEDERSRGAQERDVELGCREPLQVEDVGVPAQEPPHPSRVLERLQTRHAPRFRRRPARARVERLVEGVTVGGGALAEAERRRHELDLDARPGRAQPRARGRTAGVKAGGSARTTRTAPTVRAGPWICSSAAGTSSTGAPIRPGAAATSAEMVDARDRRPTRRPLPSGGAGLGAPPARGLEWRDDGGARDHAAPRVAGAAHSLAHALARGVLPLGSRGAGERDPRASRARGRGSRERSDQRRGPRGDGSSRAVRVRSIVRRKPPRQQRLRAPRDPARRGRVGPASSPRGTRDAGEAIVLAGDFNVRDPGLAGYSAAGRRGSTTCSCAARLATPPETWSRARRQQNGARALRPRPGRAACRLGGRVVTFAEARALFPVLETVAYLNAGTFGPLARPVAEALADGIERDLVQGRSGLPYFEATMGLREELRGAFADARGGRARRRSRSRARRPRACGIARARPRARGRATRS